MTEEEQCSIRAVMKFLQEHDKREDADRKAEQHWRISHEEQHRELKTELRSVKRKQDEMYEIYSSGNGALKVMRWLGKAVLWVSGIGTAIVVMAKQTGMIK